MQNSTKTPVQITSDRSIHSVEIRDRIESIEETLGKLYSAEVSLQAICNSLFNTVDHPRRVEQLATAVASMGNLVGELSCLIADELNEISAKI